MNTGSVLLDILIVLIAAKAAAEISERVGLPAVVGEIMAGILIGPSVLGLIGAEGSEFLHVLGEIGVILLLLEVGANMDIGDIRAVGRSALAVAVIGVVLPFIGGWAIASALGYGGTTSLFLGAALTATSVGISARVFGDLRALTGVEARTVLGAAVADDVLGLVVLTVVVRIVVDGSVSVFDVVSICGIAIGFLVIATTVGSKLGPWIFAFVNRHSRSSGTLVALALAFTLAFAQLASAAKLAPIVGAFVAGLAIGQSEQSERISREMTPVGHLFIPVFFLQIGIAVDIGQFGNKSVLLLAAALLVVAVVTKIIAAVGVIGTSADKLLVGLGMIPRGEVGLIFAAIGLREKVLDGELYAALLLVVLATTIITPPLVRSRLVRLRNAARQASLNAPEAAEPLGGWLVVADGTVDLSAHPPDRLALPIALEAAIAATHARPGTALLDWLGSRDDEELNWNADAHSLFMRALREGNARSWRFLEATGVLEQALPEVAAAVRRRRSDAFELDPVHSSRWSLVERLHDQGVTDEFALRLSSDLDHHDWLLLAAMVMEIAGEDATPVELARRLVRRFELGQDAEEEVAFLVGSVGLFRGAAGRREGITERRITQIAVHVETLERARALALLDLAIGELDHEVRVRFESLVEMVITSLQEPLISVTEARNVVEHRKLELIRILGEATPAADRAMAAPRLYLASQVVEDVVRHVELMVPPPERGKVRASVDGLPESTRGPQHWRIEIVSRDRPGLLAGITRVLRDTGVDVASAEIVTWDDGVALESFVVHALVPPDASRIQEAAEEAFAAPLTSDPVPGAIVDFDDASSPWYTICEIAVRDQPGLLHALATAFAASEIVVHSAHITTDEGVATDRFEVTDRSGGKIGGESKELLRRTIELGVVPRRRGIRAARR